MSGGEKAVAVLGVLVFIIGFSVGGLYASHSANEDRNECSLQAKMRGFDSSESSRSGCAIGDYKEDNWRMIK